MWFPSWLHHRTILRKSRPAARFRPALEVLEDRRCPSVSGTGATLAAPDAATQAHLAEAYGQLPLSFEVNQGQTDAGVNFLSRGAGYALFLTPSEAVLSLQQGSEAGAVLTMQIVGAKPTAKPVGLEQMSGVSNYLIGSDSSQWHTDVASYGRVLYQDVYTGIDLVYYGNQRQLEYDFIVAPGADAKAIRLAFEGAERMSLDGAGNLVLHTAGGDVVQHAPVVYQESEGPRSRIRQNSGIPADNNPNSGEFGYGGREFGYGGRQAVAGQYVLGKDGQVGFKIGAYDHTRPLVIDPVLSYSTYLGGNGTEYGYGIAVDQAGNAYVTGKTSSTNFPTSNGAFQTGHAPVGPNQPYDVFITKLNATGTGVVYSTYLGGSGNDSGEGIAVDAAGNAYVAGNTQSANFPTTAGAFDRTHMSLSLGYTGFMAKLNATGSALVYSTFLDNSLISGLALDPTGQLYVTGEAGPALPTTPGAYNTAPWGGKIPYRAFFATKLLPDGSGLAYSTYLFYHANDASIGPDHSGPIEGSRIAVDSLGNAYVTGRTTERNLEVSAGGLPHGGGVDAFVMKLNAAGSGRLYFTYLGGSGSEYARGIAVDGDGSAYVLIRTGSIDFPTTAGAFRPTAIGGLAAVARLNPDGSRLYATYLGYNEAYGIAVDSKTGNAFVTGWANSYLADPPPTADGLPAQGGPDAFVRALSADGSTLVYSTYLGGATGDYGYAIAMDQSGAIYLTGITGGGANSWESFPTTSNAFQTTGGTGPFVAKISFPVPGTPVASLSGPSHLVRGQPGSFILGAGDSPADPAASFSFSIDWGDGTSQTVNGPAGTAVDHVYTTARSYVVQLTGTGQDGSLLQPTSRTVTIKMVDVQGNTLAVGGTSATDKIILTAADSTGTSVTVSINGVTWTTSAPGQGILVFGQAGNDTIQINSARINKQTVYVTVPAVLFGGDGNDTLDARGSIADNFLVGGAGTDTLQGGAGRDILIGGLGADTLHGNGGDDVLIGNTTDFDGNVAALNALMAEWSRRGVDYDYQTRINHLNGSVPGGLNGSYFLNAVTIHDDAAIDNLYGETELDWFFYTATGLYKDKVNGLALGEIATAL